MRIHKKLPIGIFDSGLGGLTVVRELKRYLPHEDHIYVGDTARVPYGTKSPHTIQRYALEIALFLLKKRVKAIVVACNSASAVGLKKLRSFPIPVIGVIEPGAKAAVKGSQKKRIGVIGTHATISSHAYRNAIRNKSRKISVWENPCPLFVPLVEEGRLSDGITKKVAQVYLKPFKKKKIDVLVLGCTHYPLLKHVLSSVMGKNVKLIDSAKETAKQVKEILAHQGLLNDKKRKGKGTFFTTDDPKLFSTLGSRFLGTKRNRAKHLSLEDI